MPLVRPPILIVLPAGATLLKGIGPLCLQPPCGDYRGQGVALVVDGLASTLLVGKPREEGARVP
jgi:hypothetical protein